MTITELREARYLETLELAIERIYRAQDLLGMPHTIARVEKDTLRFFAREATRDRASSDPKMAARVYLTLRAIAVELEEEIAEDGGSVLSIVAMELEGIRGEE